MRAGRTIASTLALVSVCVVAACTGSGDKGPTAVPDRLSEAEREARKSATTPRRISAMAAQRRCRGIRTSFGNNWPPTHSLPASSSTATTCRRRP